MPRDVAMLLFGLGVGGVIGYLTSLLFARQSSQETKRIRQLINTLAHCLVEAGAIQATFDSNDDVVQMHIYRFEGTGGAAVGGEAATAVHHAPPPAETP